MTTQSEVSNFNIANVLTTLRIVMVPFFAWALLQDGGDDPTWRWVAFAIFALTKRSAFTGTVSQSAIGVSATIALVLGMVLLFFAIMGLLRLAAAHAPGHALPRRR